MTPTGIRHRRRRATVVEMAFVAPVFFMLMPGIFKFARGNWTGRPT